MEMEEKYGTMDLITTQYMNNGRPIFPTIPPPTRDLHYAMVMLGGGGGGISFGSDLGMVSAGTSGVSGDSGGGGDGNGLDMEIGGYSCVTRWPREETLALLDIRSRLDSMFKEANHKGPLWDEVSRIMCVEHGYKRTGKKCSEKFENLYKYYKKIKEGKAAGRRRDKKHYRFFHQLEAIYGETNTLSTGPPDPNKNSVSATNYATLPPCLEDNDHCVKKNINKRSMLEKKSWKNMITDFIETKMNTLMEKQDKWMEKVMHTIEDKEKERLLKEEQWRKEEAARLEKQTKFRSNQKARIESRDLALIEALQKLTKNKSTILEASSCDDQNNLIVTGGWGENEVTQLIQLRSSMETRFEQCGGYMEDVLWEEIALTMTCLGYNNRNAMLCKAKWDHINFLLRNKKKKLENNIRCSNLYSDHQHSYNIFHQAAGQIGVDQQNIDEGYRVLISDPEIMGNNYYGKI